MEISYIVDNYIPCAFTSMDNCICLLCRTKKGLLKVPEFNGTVSMHTLGEMIKTKVYSLEKCINFVILQ